MHKDQRKPFERAEIGILKAATTGKDRVKLQCMQICSYVWPAGSRCAGAEQRADCRWGGKERHNAPKMHPTVICLHVRESTHVAEPGFGQRDGGRSKGAAWAWRKI